MESQGRKLKEVTGVLRHCFWTILLAESHQKAGLLWASLRQGLFWACV